MLWRTSEFLATWIWALPGGELVEAPARARWLAEQVARAIEALDGFAVAHEASVCTASDGEDAFMADLEASGAAPLLSFLERTADVQTLDVALALACKKSEGAGEVALRVDDGASLAFDLELDEHGRLADDPFPCQLRFALHVDLYSPESRGDRALAALNGPRLREFLQRLERLLPLRFLEMEARGYSGAHRYGFE